MFDPNDCKLPVAALDARLQLSIGKLASPQLNPTLGTGVDVPMVVAVGVGEKVLCPLGRGVKVAMVVGVWLGPGVAVSGTDVEVSLGLGVFVAGTGVSEGGTGQGPVPIVPMVMAPLPGADICTAIRLLVR